MKCYYYVIGLIMVYLLGYIVLRNTQILSYDQYGFFRVPYIGRYHVRPHEDSAFSVNMWYFYIPIHFVEDRFWTISGKFTTPPATKTPQ